jgi:hypothetical protein
MAINPAIAMSFQAPKFEDPMNRLVQMEQLKAYQQNALAKQMEMESAKAALEQKKGLRNYLAGMKPGEDVDLNYLAAQFGDTGVGYAKNIAAFEKEQRLAQKAQQDSALQLHKEYWLPMLSGVNTAQQAFDWAKAYRSDPRMDALTRGTSAEEAFARLPKTDADVEKFKRDLIIPFEKQTETTAQQQENIKNRINTLIPKIRTVTPEGVVVENPAVIQEIESLRAQLTGAPAAPAAAAAMTPALGQAVEGITPVGGPAPIPVEQEPAVVAAAGQRVAGQPVEGRGTAGGEEPGLSTAEKIAAQRGRIAGAQKEAEFKILKEKERPQVIATTQSALAELDRIGSNVDKLLGTKTGDDPNSPKSYEGHPGLDYVTGRFMGTELGREVGRKITDEAADAAALQDTLEAQKFTAAIAQLKALSSTGASGLGSLALREGDKIQTAYANLISAVGTDTYKQRLIDFNNQIKESKTLLKNKLTSAYGEGSEKPSKGAETPAAASTPAATGKVMDWNDMSD